MILGFFWNGNLNKNISFSGNIKSWKKAVHNLEIQGYGICYDNCLKKEHVCQIQVLGWKPQYITRRRPIPYTFFGTILLFYWHSSFGVHILNVQCSCGLRGVICMIPINLERDHAFGLLSRFSVQSVFVLHSLL